MSTDSFHRRGVFAELKVGTTIPQITLPATMVAEAANNHVWISCHNSSARESCWPGFLVRPDGVVTGRLRRNVAGVLISEVDTDQEIYDSTVDWRDRALNGVLHSGTLVSDEIESPYAVVEARLAADPPSCHAAVYTVSEGGR